MLSVSAWTLLAVLGAGGETVLLDFTASWCGPCRAMEPVVQRLQAEGCPVRKVDIDQQPQLAAQFGVTSVPCFVMLCDGREVDRAVGAVGYDRLARMFSAARVAPQSSSASEPEIRGQSPDRLGLGGRLRQMVGGGRDDRAAPPRPSTTPPDAYSASATPYGATSAVGPEPPAALGDLTDLGGTGSPAPMASPAAQVPAMAPSFGADREAMAPPTSTTPPPYQPAAETATAAGNPSAEQRALAASVRLRIDDGQFFSYATGAVIAVRPQGEALILTCGHVFRDSQGRGTISVDLFGSQRQGPIPGRLVAYDLNRDLGLVSVAASGAVSPVRIAGQDMYLRDGSRVFSVGCDRGAEPTLRECRITGINRYLGTPNLVATNRPVVGRSGGGLFDSQGNLLGVCRAADSQVDEGVYVSYQAIAAQLSEWRLEELLLSQPQPAALAQQPAAPIPAEAREQWTVSEDRPADFDYTQAPRGSVAERSSFDRLPASPATGPASEPVFIVRGRTPGEGDVMLLEQPSAAFLAQLAQESVVRVPANGQISAAVRSAADSVRISQVNATPVVRGQSPSHDHALYAKPRAMNR